MVLGLEMGWRGRWVGEGDGFRKGVEGRGGEGKGGRGRRGEVKGSEGRWKTKLAIRLCKCAQTDTQK